MGYRLGFALCSCLMVAASGVPFQQRPEDRDATTGLPSPDGAGYIAGLGKANSGLPLPEAKGVTIHSTSTPVSGVSTIFKAPEHVRVYKRSAAGVVVILPQRVYGNILTPHSLGSGFTISKDGFVVTNRHVVEGCDAVTVILKDPTHKTVKMDRAYQAKFGRAAVVVGKGGRQDLALLKILNPPEDLAVLSFSDPSEIEPAQDVMAIGHPMDYEIASTDSPVSFWDFAPGMIRNVQEKGGYKMLIRHTTPINKGNSGGPLLNLEGRVVGVNTMKPPRESEQDGVFWSVGMADLAEFLSGYEALMKKDFGMPPGPQTLSAKERWGTLNLGFLASGQRAMIKLKVTAAEGGAKIILHHERPVAAIVREGGRWNLMLPEGGGWKAAKEAPLDAASAHDIEFRRSATELTAHLDGDAVGRLSDGLVSRGWTFLTFVGLEMSISKE